MSNQFCCLYQERLCGKGSVPLVVHLDGKLLQDLTRKEHVDRLPVLVSGHGVNKLYLVCQKLTSGTGENTAAAVYTLLQDWSVADQFLLFGEDLIIYSIQYAIPHYNNIR